ncbi:MAG: phage/plasmid primase, P4 family [Cellulosilyticaceae bacterium]
MQLEELLGRLEKVKSNGANSYICCCPAHGDKEPSLSIKEVDDRLLMHCHAGCDMQNILSSIGLEVKDLFKTNKNTLTLTWQEKVKVWHHNKKGQLPLEELYPYYDDSQKVLYYKARYKGKKIRHFRIDGDTVIWKDVFKDRQKTLYNKSAIQRARDNEEPIYYVEGEKDVHTMEILGLLATTAGGATSWYKDLAIYFEGLDVIILQDNDEAGEKLSRQIIQDLCTTAKSVKVVIPSNKAHGDVTDYIQEGHTKYQLLELIGEKEEEKLEEKVALKHYRLDDTDNADTMAQLFGDSLCYAYDLNKWFMYNGVKWQEDRVDGVRLLANQMIDRMQDDFELLTQAIEDDKGRKKQEKLYSLHLKSCRSNRGKTSILNETKHLLPIVSTTFNTRRELLNTPQATYNIIEKTLYPHNPQDYVSQSTSIPIVKGAKAPTWEKFIDEIFLGDKELIRYVQKAIGYSLTGFTREQCMFIGYGDGANGKGVFKDILSYVLNDYVKCPQAETISQIRQGSEASPDIVNLMDARFVVCVESNKGVRFNEGLIKQLTGEDKVTARRLYCEPVSFTPQFKLWLFTNHTPEIVGTDTGIWRRLKIIPFALDLAEDKKDRDLKDKLMKEVEGIFWWCIQGIDMYLEEGLKEPQVMIDIAREFRGESDLLGQFLCDSVIAKEGNRVQAKELYSQYLEWCRENNETPDNRTRFGLDMKKRLKKIHDGRYVYYVDIALTLSVKQFVKA